MVQVTVAGMILDPQTRGPVVLLHIDSLDRYLPIWVGTSEAAAIAMVLHDEKFDRPLTHDLLVTVIDGLDGRVSRVVVADVVDGTFFAKIFIARNDDVISLDCRPSDALSVALRADAPVFVTEVVLESEKSRLLELDKEQIRSYFGTIGLGLDNPDSPGETDEH